MSNSAWDEDGRDRNRGALQVRVGQRSNRDGSLASLDTFDRQDRSSNVSAREGFRGDTRVEVSRGRGQDGGALKTKGHDRRGGGSQSGTPRGRRDDRGENQNFWRGGSSNTNWDRDEVSSVVSNEERGRNQGRPRRGASSGSEGSWDGRRSPKLTERSPRGGGRGGPERGDTWKAWTPQGGPWMGARGQGGKGRGWHEDHRGTGGQGWREERPQPPEDTRWRRGEGGGGGRNNTGYQQRHQTAVSRVPEVYKARSTISDGAGLRPPQMKLGPSQSFVVKDIAVMSQDSQNMLKDQEREVGRSKDRDFVPARAVAAYCEGDSANENDLVSAIVGTCPDMCPAREREQRQRLRDLAYFERINGNVAKTSASLAVKKFCRTFSSVDLQPSDVRPLPVLWRTLQYLLHMLDRRDCTFEAVHAFLFDRTRAVRQELGMQCIANSQAITMFEEIVRFHIMSERELREKTSGGGNDVDSHLNFQQLSKSLLTLLNLYGVVDTGNDLRFQHEAEFHSYYVLLNLGDRDQFKAEPLSLWFHRVHPRVLQAPEFIYARRVLRCYRNDNYRGFFELAKNATYLQGCLMELYFGKVRRLAIEALNHGGYKLHPYPMADIAKLLLMKESDAEELCTSHGLATGIDKSSGSMSLLAKQAHFTPSTRSFRHQCSLINRKRAPTYFQEVTAGESFSLS